MSMGPNALQQGTLSIASFYATKMMTTGQGGAIFTDHEQLADELRDLISYDNREDYKLRFNYAPTDLAAALGLAQLKRLDEFLAQRKELANTYDQLIQQHCPDLLAQPNGLSSDYPYLFRYWIKSKHKQALQEHLEKKNIESKSPVYKPLHQYLGFEDSDFPHCTQSQREVLSLPFYPGLQTKDLQRVVEALKSF
jgi:dTDP-4-amino-4,6-dideoxygalactose transaminase